MPICILGAVHWREPVIQLQPEVPGYIMTNLRPWGPMKKRGEHGDARHEHERNQVDGQRQGAKRVSVRLYRGS